MTIRGKVYDEIEKLAEAMTASLCRIVRFPAISPHNGGIGEDAKSKEIAAIMKELNFPEPEWYYCPDEKSPTGNRPSMVVRIPGKSDAERIWFIAHMDVVPAGDLNAWNTDPFEPVVKDGRIYGRGTQDNGQPIIASMHAAHAIRMAGAVPAREVCLCYVADEEMGSEYGIQYLIEQNLFRQGDLVVVPDGGPEVARGDFVQLAEKGILWMEFSAIGNQVHASTPQLGVNACRAANIFSAELDEVLHSKFTDTDDLFSPNISTFEPTRRGPNVPSINIVPGIEKFAFDCRLVPSVSTQQVIDVVEGVRKKVEASTGAKITYELPQRSDPAPVTSKDSPIVKMVVKAMDEIVHVMPNYGGMGGGTCAAYLRRLGIPAVGWDQNTDGTAHQPNEHSRIDFMLNETKVFAHLMLDEQE